MILEELIPGEKGWIKEINAGVQLEQKSSKSRRNVLFPVRKQFSWAFW